MTHEQYIRWIQREPLDTMVKVKEEYKYIPLSVIQSELILLYQGMTKWEMMRETVTKDGVYGVGKLHYRLPFFDTDDSGMQELAWVFQTGTAAIPITKKLRLSYPSLEAHCILNAVKKIGPWFGANLNRDQEDEELEEDGLPVIQIADERLILLIEQAKTLEDLAALKDKVNDNTKVAYMKKIKILTTK